MADAEILNTTSEERKTTVALAKTLCFYCLLNSSIIVCVAYYISQTAHMLPLSGVFRHRITCSVIER